jgi:hypothetical protein
MSVVDISRKYLHVGKTFNFAISDFTNDNDMTRLIEARCEY